MCHEHIKSFCIPGLRRDENLILPSEFAKPSNKIIISVVIAFYTHKEIIGRRIFSTNDVMSSTFGTSHRFDTILHRDSHEANGLMVNAPSTA